MYAAWSDDKILFVMKMTQNLLIYNLFQQIIWVQE